MASNVRRRSCHGFMNSLGLSSDSLPILFAHVFINLNGCAPAVQRIAASLLRTGNPIILARLDAVIIGFEARAFEALERLTVVIERPASLGKPHATNASITSEPASFAFDIHDAS